MRSNIKIRKMTIEDLDGVMEVEEKSFTIPWSRQSFEEELFHNKYAVYNIATYHNKIVGYIGMWKVVDEVNITNVAVHPEYRSLGIGSALLGEVIKIANVMNMVNIYLEVRQSNLLAQKLYEKFGFQKVGRRKQYYSDNREDALLMTKELQM